jgi:hypothetical protein
MSVSGSNPGFRWTWIGHKNEDCSRTRFAIVNGDEFVVPCSIFLCPPFLTRAWTGGRSPMPNSPSEGDRRRLVRIGGAVAAGFGILALLGWALGFPSWPGSRGT